MIDDRKNLKLSFEDYFLINEYAKKNKQKLKDIAHNMVKIFVHSDKEFIDNLIENIDNKLNQINTLYNQDMDLDSYDLDILEKEADIELNNIKKKE